MSRQHMKIVATEKAAWKAIRSEAEVKKNLLFGASIGKYLDAFQRAFAGTEGLRKAITNDPEPMDVRFKPAAAEKVGEVVNALENLTAALEKTKGRLANEKKENVKKVKNLRDSAAKSSSKKAALEKEATDLEDAFEFYETTVKDMHAEAIKKLGNWVNAAKGIDALIQCSAAIEEHGGGALLSVKEAIDELMRVPWTTGTSKELEKEFLLAIGILNSVAMASDNIRRDSEGYNETAQFGKRMKDATGEVKKLISNSHMALRLMEDKLKADSNLDAQQSRDAVNIEIESNVSKAMGILQDMLKEYSTVMTRPTR